jgi:hypothetical protein
MSAPGGSPGKSQTPPRAVTPERAQVRPNQPDLGVQRTRVFAPTTTPVHGTQGIARQLNFTRSPNRSRRKGRNRRHQSKTRRRR